MKIQFDFSELHEFSQELVNDAKFQKYGKRMVREVAKAVVDHIKTFTPQETGTLIRGWDKRKVAVVKKADGFEIMLVNDVPYAAAVNDGHLSYNQYGGPYEVKRRIKLTSPHAEYQGESEWYVYGHFFVERGILQLKSTNEVEEILEKEIEKWWRDV